MHTFYITVPSERPDFRAVIAFLWHDGQNVDTEGNSHHPASRTWTELYVQNRERKDEVVSVGQQQESPLVLAVESEQEHLAARVAFFLSTYCGGGVSDELNGDYRSPDTLLALMGVDFIASEALRRAAQSP
ncbi:MAG TPA: hypothetical protein VKG92_08050, partial [Flavobacteriales bacterium]|nr:hypothetical protein [Flavobacteriales bacterium]